MLRIELISVFERTCVRHFSFPFFPTIMGYVYLLSFLRIKKIRFELDKIFHCPDCDFIYYHNTAAAAGCLISIPETDGEERLMLLVRGKEPMKGKLDLPGGFVDPGENILEGLYRELKEEIGWAPPITAESPLTQVFKFFASFPNVYPYKNITYNTCDLFFNVLAPGLREQDLRLEKSEISAVRFLRPQEIDFEEIAFESMKQVIRAYLKQNDRYP